MGLNAVGAFGEMRLRSPQQCPLPSIVPLAHARRGGETVDKVDDIPMNFEKAYEKVYIIIDKIELQGIKK